MILIFLKGWGPQEWNSNRERLRNRRERVNNFFEVLFCALNSQEKVRTCLTHLQECGCCPKAVLSDTLHTVILCWQELKHFCSLLIPQTATTQEVATQTSPCCSSSVLPHCPGGITSNGEQVVNSMCPFNPGLSETPRSWIKTTTHFTQSPSSLQMVMPLVASDLGWISMSELV